MLTFFFSREEYVRLRSSCVSLNVFVLAIPLLFAAGKLIRNGNERVHSLCYIISFCLGNSRRVVDWAAEYGKGYSPHRHTFIPVLQLKTAEQENILINVTAGTLADAQLQDSNNLQINLNISVGEEQVLVNDVPVELSGVTRFNCQALLLDSINGSSEFESGDLVSTVTRVMVSQNRLYSSSEEVLALQVFSEVIEMDGKEVQQPDMCEVKILMSPDFQKLAQFTNIYPIGHSEIFRVPRENDVVVTDPPNSRTDEEQLISQTTSEYPLKHTETTREEIGAPGKLPETPLRMDPDLLYDVRYDDELDDSYPSQPDLNQMETPPKEFVSSYSAMCQWVEQTRERLRRFCSESLPLFFLVMWVVVIGVVGSAVVVKILDVFFPACEQKHIFHVNPVPVIPEDEKHNLLENMEIEVEDEEKKP